MFGATTSPVHLTGGNRRKRASVKRPHNHQEVNRLKPEELLPLFYLLFGCENDGRDYTCIEDIKRLLEGRTDRVWYAITYRGDPSYIDCRYAGAVYTHHQRSAQREIRGYGLANNEWEALLRGAIMWRVNYLEWRLAAKKRVRTDD